MLEIPNYKDGVTYWSSVPATVDGMLGGYGTGRVPRLDIQHSTLFLKQLAPHLCPPYKAVDCGAGIGRITRDMLVNFAAVVDIVEPCEPFTDLVKNGPDLQAAREAGKIGYVMTIGLEAFKPEFGKYGLIWCQWCLGQLTDEDLVSLLQRCKSALRPEGGLVCVKENLIAGEDLFDTQDSSVTRTEESFLRIFKAAGLKIVRSSIQHGFPKELFKVKVWALR